MKINKNEYLTPKDIKYYQLWAFITQTNELSDGGTLSLLNSVHL